MTSIALLSALRKNRPLSCIVSKMNLETMKWIFSSCKGSFLYQGWGSRRSCGWKSENPSSSHLQWPFSNINNSRKPRVEISFKNQMIFCISCKKVQIKHLWVWMGCLVKHFYVFLLNLKHSTAFCIDLILKYFIL